MNPPTHTHTHTHTETRVSNSIAWTGTVACAIFSRNGVLREEDDRPQTPMGLKGIIDRRAVMSTGCQPEKGVSVNEAREETSESPSKGPSSE